MHVLPRKIIVEPAICSAVLNARVHGVVAAGEQTDRPPRTQGTAFGMNVHNACRTIPIFRWQRARQEVHIGKKASVQGLSKEADGLRNDNAINAVLEVCVIASDMKLPVLVLRNPWCLQ